MKLYSACLSMFGAKVEIILLAIADYVEFNTAPRTGIDEAVIGGQVEAHLDKTTIVLKAYVAPYANGCTARDGVADQCPVRRAAHDTVGE